MKKVFISILWLFFCALSGFANDFAYIDNGIYIKKNSISHNNGWYSAIFKVLDETDPYYKILKYKASCDDRKILGIVSTFDLDKNNKLLKEHVADKNVYPVDPSGYVNGYLYYNAICRILKTR